MVTNIYKSKVMTNDLKRRATSNVQRTIHRYIYNNDNKTQRCKLKKKKTALFISIVNKYQCEGIKNRNPMYVILNLN